MRGLKGKRVLITGGARGIGAATAARFMEEGARVVVLEGSHRARRSALLLELTRRLEGRRSRCSFRETPPNGRPRRSVTPRRRTRRHPLAG